MRRRQARENAREQVTISLQLFHKSPIISDWLKTMAKSILTLN